MKKSDAKTIIKNFINKNKGKNILFHKLNDEDKKAYMLTKSFIYFNKFLSTNESIERAISNTKAHEEDNYAVYNDNMNEHIIIK